MVYHRKTNSHNNRFADDDERSVIAFWLLSIFFRFVARALTLNFGCVEVDFGLGLWRFGFRSSATLILYFYLTQFA